MNHVHHHRPPQRHPQESPGHGTTQIASRPHFEPGCPPIHERGQRKKKHPRDVPPANRDREPKLQSHGQEQCRVCSGATGTEPNRTATNPKQITMAQMARPVVRQKEAPQTRAPSHRASSSGGARQLLRLTCLRTHLLVCPTGLTSRSDPRPWSNRGTCLDHLRGHELHT